MFANKGQTVILTQTYQGRLTSIPAYTIFMLTLFMPTPQTEMGLNHNYTYYDNEKSE